MKSLDPCSTRSLWKRLSAVLAITIATSCITANGANRFSVHAPPPLFESIRNALGVVGLLPPQTSGGFEFGSPSAKAGYASDGAENARDMMYQVAREELQVPYIGPALSASTVALTPLGSAIGAVVESRKRLLPDALSETAAEVANAGAQLPLSTYLQRAFLNLAQRELHDPFRVQPLGATPDAASATAARPRLLLELDVERSGLDAISAHQFVFVLNVRARLFRASDRAVLYNEVFQYRSGPALFLDWASNGGATLAAVAETGCRYLAESIVQQLFVTASDLRLASARSNVRAPKASVPARPSVAQVARSAPLRSGVNVRSPHLKPDVLVNLGRIGVVATSTTPNLSAQRPLTKERALWEARDAVQSRVNEIEDIPYVNLAAFGAAIPSSLARQFVGGFKGLTETGFHRANSAVCSVVSEVNLPELLREAVHLQARQATRQPVVLVKKPFPPGDEREFSQMRSVMSGTLAWIPEGQTAQQYLISEGIDTLLELELVDPALKGNGTINPPMAFSSEVRCRLVRVREQEPLYSCVVTYRGAPTGPLATQRRCGMN